MIPVEWCGICSSAPADGELGILIEGDEEYLYACTPCAEKALNA